MRTLCAPMQPLPIYTSMLCTPVCITSPHLPDIPYMYIYIEREGENICHIHIPSLSLFLFRYIYIYIYVYIYTVCIYYRYIYIYIYIFFTYAGVLRYCVPNAPRVFHVAALVWRALDWQARHHLTLLLQEWEQAFPQFGSLRVLCIAKTLAVPDQNFQALRPRKKHGEPLLLLEEPDLPIDVGAY